MKKKPIYRRAIGLGVVFVALWVGGGSSTALPESRDPWLLPFGLSLNAEASDLEAWSWALWEAAEQGDVEALRKLWPRPSVVLEERGSIARALDRILWGRWAPPGDLLPPGQGMLSLLHLLKSGRRLNGDPPEDWSEEFLQRLPAPEETARWKERALAALLPLLQDPDPDVRKQAAAALGTLRDKRAVPDLIHRLLVEQEGVVLEEVIAALGAIGDRRAVPPLIDLLGYPGCSFELFGPSICVPAAAAEALGRIGDPRAVEPLIALLDHPELLVEIAVIQALGRIGDLRALEPLLRHAARGSRGGFFFPSTVEVVAIALADLGKRAVPRLIEALDDRSLNVRAAAALALGLMREAAAVPALGRALSRAGTKDPAADSFAFALGALGDPRAVPILREALFEDDVSVVEASAEALGALRAEEAVPDLIARIRELHAEEIRFFLGIFCRALSQIGSGAVPALLEALEGAADPPEVRYCWIAALGEIGDPRATLPLLEGPLREEDEGIRAAAAVALGQIRDPRAEDGLRAALRGDASAWVRASAAEALGRLRGELRPETVEALIAALADPACGAGRRSPCVPEAAARALGEQRAPEAFPALLDLLERRAPTRVRVAAVSALGLFQDPRAIPVLLDSVRRTPRSELREAVREALVRIGTAGLPALEQALREHPSGRARGVVAEVLGQLEDPRVVGVLLIALEDRSADVRRRAVETLGEQGAQAQEAIPQLVELLRADPDFAVRTEAARALGQIGSASPEVKAALLAALEAGICLREEARCVPAAAAEALGRLGVHAAVPALLAAAAPERPELVRVRAVEALGRLRAAEALPALLEFVRTADPEVFEASLKALVALGDPAVEPLLALWPEIAEREWMVQVPFVRALGELGDPRAVPVLLEAIRRGEWIVIRGAVDALVEIGPPAVPELFKVLEEEPRDSHVWEAAFVALARIPTPETLALLRRHLAEDPDAQVREFAARTLGLHRDREAVSSLIEALDDSERDVRRAAAEALAAIGDPRAVEPLIEKLARSVHADPNGLYYGVALALIGSPAVPVLLEALGHENPEVRMIAAAALGVIPSSAAVAASALIEALEDPVEGVRYTAAAALGALRVERAVPALIVRAREDRSVDVRIRAVRSLGLIGSPSAAGFLQEIFHGPDACSDTPEALFGDPPCLRAEAALALGRVGAVEAVPDLIAALEDVEGETGQMRENAATALGLLGDRRATLPLINSAWNDPADGVRRAAAFALADLGDPDATAPLWHLAVDPRSPTRDYATVALLRVDLRLGISAFVRYLEEILVESPDPLLGALRLVLFLFLVQEHGLDALLADPGETSAALAEALRNPDPVRRLLVFFAVALLPDGFLARAEGQPLHEALLGLLSGPDPVFQSMAALFLGRIAAHAGYEVLIRLAEGLPERLLFLLTGRVEETRIDVATALHLLAQRAEQFREALPQLEPRTP